MNMESTKKLTKKLIPAQFAQDSFSSLYNII